MGADCSIDSRSSASEAWKIAIRSAMMSRKAGGNHMNDIAHVIELAVAPVFLLAGIGAFVNAFAMRLGRIFDRIRLLERESKQAEPERKRELAAELTVLTHRARLGYYGIAMTIFSAFLVCVLVTLAFLAYFLGFEGRLAIGGLFIAAMLSLIGGLLTFLREVFTAVNRVSIAIPPAAPSEGTRS